MKPGKGVRVIVSPLALIAHQNSPPILFKTDAVARIQVHRSIIPQTHQTGVEISKWDGGVKPAGWLSFVI
jgi:hypothetical protein